MTGTSKAAAKFTGSKAKCAIKCQQNASKTVPLNPRSDCYSPYDGTTQECIVSIPLKPGKSAEEAYVAAIRKGCDPAIKATNDCPECFDGGTDCNQFAQDRMALNEGQIDTFGPGVFCKGQGAAPTEPTKEELACEVNCAKSLVKLVGSINKCYDKCNSGLRKSLVAPGDCNPPADDPIAAACLQKARDKAIAGCDKKCALIGVVPDCNESTPAGAYPSGSDWVTAVDAVTQGNQPGTYCASPSGAFLN